MQIGTAAIPHAAKSDANPRCERLASLSSQVPQERAAPWSRAIDSCSDGEPQNIRIRLHFAVLDFLSNDSERKRLRPKSSLVRRRSINCYAGQFGNVAYPTSVGFSQQPNRELHTCQS